MDPDRSSKSAGEEPDYSFEEFDNIEEDDEYEDDGAEDNGDGSNSNSSGVIRDSGVNLTDYS